jgi:hypothetical protein
MSASVTRLACITIASPEPEALPELLGTGLGWETLADGPVTERHERPRHFANRWAGVERAVSKAIDALWEALQRQPAFNLWKAPSTMGITRPRGREFPPADEMLGMTPILSSSFDRGPWHALWGLHAPTGHESGLINPEPAINDRFDGGICIVIYVTPDIEAAFRALPEDKRARVLSEPHAIDDDLYRGSRCLALQGPHGERMALLSTS